MVMTVKGAKPRVKTTRHPILELARSENHGQTEMRRTKAAMMKIDHGNGEGVIQ
jgi:hypothetical protein